MRAVENLMMPETIDGEPNAEIIGCRCYRVEDLEIILGISRVTVYRLLAKQEFRWFKIGSSYRISKKSFDEWLDQRM